MDDAIEKLDAIEAREWSRHRAVTRAMADKRRAFVVRLDLVGEEDEQPALADGEDHAPEQPNGRVLGHEWLNASTVTPSADNGGSPTGT